MSNENINNQEIDYGKYIRENSHEACIDYFTTLLEKEPSNKKTLYYRAQIYHRLGQNINAINDLIPIISQDKKNKEFLILRMKVLMEIGDCYGAEEDIKLILELDSSNKEACMLLGKIRLKQKKREEAKKIFSELGRNGVKEAYLEIEEIEKSKIKNFLKEEENIGMIIGIFILTFIILILSYLGIDEINGNTPKVERIWPFIYLNNGVFTDFDYTEFLFINILTFVILWIKWRVSEPIDFEVFMKNFFGYLLIFLVIPMVLKSFFLENNTIDNYHFWPYSEFVLNKAVLNIKAMFNGGGFYPEGILNGYDISEAMLYSFFGYFTCLIVSKKKVEDFFDKNILTIQYFALSLIILIIVLIFY